jgi:hypothetical protein
LLDICWNILTMHGPINVKSPNNTSKWQMGFNSAFKGLTLVDFQRDAQNSYLFIYNTFIKSSLCFEHYPAHLQEVYVVIVCMQPLVLSLCKK